MNEKALMKYFNISNAIIIPRVINNPRFWSMVLKCIWQNDYKPLCLMNKNIDDTMKKKCERIGNTIIIFPKGKISINYIFKYFFIF